MPRWWSRPPRRVQPWMTRRALCARSCTSMMWAKRMRRGRYGGRSGRPVRSDHPRGQWTSGRAASPSRNSRVRPLTTAKSGKSSDVDAVRCVTAARNDVYGEGGIYSDERVAGRDRAVLKRWFLRGGGSSTGAGKVRPELRAKIRFRQLNLMEPLPLRGPLDVVFCRNVVIYFSKETQRMIFGKFAACMAPGSHLFIGHSETLFRISDAFESLGQTVYRRRA